MHELRAYAGDTIRKGSKSFSAASLIFGQKDREAAHYLYAWLRHCDDRIDGAPDHPSALEAWTRIRDLTARAASGAPIEDPAFLALARVRAEYGIPGVHLEEFLEGMRMDLVKPTYEWFDELEVYCYRVAGVVGVMMCHIMGVSDPRALRHAADLGIAMQLTNIARDVFDDHAIGRVYLPQHWLRGEGIDPDGLLEERHRDGLVRTVKRVLEEADRRYRSGYEGLRYLSLRSAFAVSAAGEIYSSIGTIVRARGREAWERRAVVSKWGKLRAIGRAALRVAALAPARMKRPWKPVSIPEVSQ